MSTNRTDGDLRARREALTGAWMLTGWEKNGRPCADFGPRPTGCLVYGAGGKMFGTMMATGRPLRGAALVLPWNALALVHTFLSHFSFGGAWEVVSPDTVVHQLESCSFATWIGSEQRRSFRVAGETLTLVWKDGKTEHALTWQRA